MIIFCCYIINMAKEDSKKKSKKNKDNKEGKDVLDDTRWRMMRIAGGRRKKTVKNNHNDYIIAIPSYKREETLKNKTLRVLKEQKIPKNKIFIFVGNEEEYTKYKKTLPKYYNKIIIGQVGMGAIRNFITNYFSEGQKIFNMDDDINGFVELTKEKNKNTKSKFQSKNFKSNDLDKFIKKGFDECKKNNLSLFGIYPASNPFFMKKRITYDLRYIIGSCWGCVNNKSVKVSMDDKEDFERTLKYYKTDGGVVRFENITVISGYYTEKGGMQETRTKDRVLKSAQKLVNQYPDLCKLYLGKKSGYAEVKLKDIKKKYTKNIESKLI